jgi:predicted amidophosphoribosyltransferase
MSIPAALEAKPDCKGAEMKCLKCGAEIRKGARICDHCGISLEEYGIVRESSQAEEKPGARRSGQLSTGARKKLIISFIVLDFLLAVAMIIYFLRL